MRDEGLCERVCAVLRVSQSAVQLRCAFSLFSLSLSLLNFLSSTASTTSRHYCTRVVTKKPRTTTTTDVSSVGRGGSERRCRLRGFVGFAGGGRFSFEVVVRGLTALTAHDREVGFTSILELIFLDGSAERG